jgi:crotonobetainyl-CoA:carnitine CoA-transferase CaiB-like acyl-CoA transferase
MKPLEGIRLLSLATNIPGPVAVARLVQLGASGFKIEPPAGDPLVTAAPSWYAHLHEGIQVSRLDLKSAGGQSQLHDLLAESDLLITANRPAALIRLGLVWPGLAGAYPRLCQVAIFGHSPPDSHKAGHDLTYQAGLGLVDPPYLPRIVLADLAGAEWAVSAALALLIGRDRAASDDDRYTQIALADAAAAFAAPLRYGLTAPGGLLAGSLPGYNLYPAQEGWVAVAVLESHFMRRLAEELGLIGRLSGLETVTRETLSEAFLRRPAGEWERWAVERDLPIVAVVVS